MDVGLVVEDVRFEAFLEPAIRQLAGSGRVSILRAERTRGCRSARLRALADDLLPICDLLIVGADAKRRGRAVTYRRKSRALLDLLDGHRGVLPAVAAPSVEAWLFCEPAAFAEGLEAGTGVRFCRPSTWPTARTESEAKACLGRLLHDGLGDALPNAGFEYAVEIVARMDLRRVSNPSLAAWARDFGACLGR